MASQARAKPIWDDQLLRDAAQSRGLPASLWREVRRRARSGDANAQFLLGYSPFSLRVRRKWLKVAADQGHAEACFELAWTRHLDGWRSREGSWLWRAAELGWPQAQRDLGATLATQARPDLKNARFWYTQAALQGHHEAMYDAGLMILLGEGGPASVAEGLAWLEQVAGSDEYPAKEAAKVLGSFYEDGLHGVPKDLRRATGWFARQRKLERADRAWRMAQRLMEQQFPKSRDPRLLSQVLHEYLKFGDDLEIIQQLLTRGARPNGPLSMAGENLELVQILVAAGARVGQDDSVHQACQGGNLKLVRFLLKFAGGHVALNRRDPFGMTPLDWATAECQSEIIQILADELRRNG